MKYMLLIYGDPSLAPKTQAEGEAMHADYGVFTEKIQASGEMQSGDPLQGVDTATSVRVRDTKTLTTDGPFAETKEQLGGFYIVDVPHLDRALELAAQCPGARYGTIEVRPIMDFGA